MALAASGLLDPRIGGKPVYPYQPEGIWETLAITKERDFTYPASSGEDLYRRSLYTFWRRTVGPANMFDASSRQACKVRPTPTNTPLHALTTLNDPTWVEAARVLAERLMTAARRHRRPPDRSPSAASPAARPPQTDLTRPAQRLLNRQLRIYHSDPDSRRSASSASAPAPRDAALTAAEHAAMDRRLPGIFNLDEALTRE